MTHCLCAESRSLVGSRPEDYEMTNALPRVSIGLPVYNGGRFLREAIDSFLAQTFEDFELIISDDASKDDTEQVCRAYAAQDSRIAYTRNQHNFGGYANFIKVANLARGEYYKKSSQHDKPAPDFLRRCIEVLDADPSVVLCFSLIDAIDECGEVVERRAEAMRFNGDSPHGRLRNYFACDRVSETIYGLVRTDVLRRTQLEQPWYGSDRALLQELALHGGFHVIDEHLFYHRGHDGRSWHAPDRTAWFTPALAGRTVPGYWMHLASNFSMLRRAGLSRRESILCLREYVRHGGNRWKIWWPILIRELAGWLKDRLPSGPGVRGESGLSTEAIAGEIDFESHESRAHLASGQATREQRTSD